MVEIITSMIVSAIFLIGVHIYKQQKIKSIEKYADNKFKTNSAHEKPYLNHCWNCGASIDNERNAKCRKCYTYYTCNACGKCLCDNPNYTK